VISSFFSPVCHQIPEYSLSLFGYPLAVCARCTAIYFGFFAGVVLSPKLSRYLRHRYVFWIIAVLPMTVDVVCSWIHVHESTLLSRLATGSLFGVLAALQLVPILVDALNGIFSHFRIGCYEPETR